MTYILFSTYIEYFNPTFDEPQPITVKDEIKEKETESEKYIGNMQTSQTSANASALTPEKYRSANQYV